jgi:hypothetical protein
MDLRDCSIRDIKAKRPDLYSEIEQEVLLGTIKLRKDDIISMLQPVSDRIIELLCPHLDTLSEKTTCDIIEMENDIIDEISCQLQDMFCELEETVRGRYELGRFEAREITPLLDRKKYNL